MTIPDEICEILTDGNLRQFNRMLNELGNGSYGFAVDRLIFFLDKINEDQKVAKTI